MRKLPFRMVDCLTIGFSRFKFSTQYYVEKFDVYGHELTWSGLYRLPRHTMRQWLTGLQYCNAASLSLSAAAARMRCLGN